MKRAVLALAALAAAGFAFAMIAVAEDGMSTQDYKWEWPAGRDVTGKVAAKITGIKAASGGLFGIKKSPSFGDALPDPVVVKAQVVASAPELSATDIEVTLPKLELGTATEGAVIAIGTLATDTAVCVAVIPKGDGADPLAWLAEWDCTAD